ncbi:MAG: Smr/MutS family protein [Alphaproteobacteria bacterium]
MDDEDNPWDEVIKDVKPLKKPVKVPVPAKKPSGRAETGTGFTLVIEPKKKADVKAPRGAGLDGRTDERLRKGQTRPEARIDLHGYRLAEAEEALCAFIVRAYAGKKRCVLVITGKGHAEAGAKLWYEGASGSIRALVPGWLAAPGLKDMILKTHPAQPKDGGDGALYVLLRRQRD